MSEKANIVPDRTGYVRVESGTRQIYWEYFGRGEREVVVLLNGVGVMTRKQIMIPGSGHLTYQEKPELFWSTVKKFLAAKSIHFD